MKKRTVQRALGRRLASQIDPATLCTQRGAGTSYYGSGYQGSNYDVYAGDCTEYGDVYYP